MPGLIETILQHKAAQEAAFELQAWGALQAGRVSAQQLRGRYGQDFVDRLYETFGREENAPGRVLLMGPEQGSEGQGATRIPNAYKGPFRNERDSALPPPTLDPELWRRGT